MKKKALPKKRTVSHAKSSSVRRVTRKPQGDDQYVVLVRSWVFMVLFAIMLGVGVMVGNYINNQLNGSSPTVAGYSTER